MIPLRFARLGSINIGSINNRSTRELSVYGVRHGVRDGTRRRRGAAAIELAITVPLLLFLLLGVIEAGRYVRAVVTVANAARNGASYASATTAASGDQEAIRRAVLDEMASFNTTDSNPNVAVQTKQDARNYSVVTVSVDYQFMPLMRFPGIPHKWQVNRAVQMRILS